jgi:hypothetical protein
MESEECDVDLRVQIDTLADILILMPPDGLRCALRAHLVALLSAVKQAPC